jgi:hypothetical protein
MKMGIIAEDDSDVAVVREITLSLLKPHRIGFKRFVGHGCGKLKRKCGAWARILVRQGCPWIVVVHDLDVNNEQQLRNQLTEAISHARARTSVVLIPKREIEAWLLYDGGAIAAAFNERQQPKLPGDPESLFEPKKHLFDLIWKKYRKEYLSTIHNAIIAKRIDVSHLKKSRSFSPHPVFTAKVRKMLR